MKNISADTNIKSVLNFRDAGGLKLTGGGTMRKGLIYRSASPDRISGRDFKKLQALGIKTIADLRDPAEFSKRKVKIPGISIINLPLSFESVTRERLRPLMKRSYDPGAINRVINGLYIDIVDAVRPVLGRTAELILETDNTPLLIHCQAGKDRTGVLSALFQMIAGAERDEIIRDYMASNESMVPHYTKLLRIRRLITLGLFPADSVLHAITQKKEDIITVFDRIDNHYGGINEYFSGSGFDITKTDQLRNILIDK
ncbi:MAG: tyrosine-protein phosphatase [Bacteroidales bacterium]|jgi:protein-tyrosine phosphatase|nr:tyrosine-protein phosphatase [Bacteroidales bacterium]